MPEDIHSTVKATISLTIQPIAQVLTLSFYKVGQVECLKFIGRTLESGFNKCPFWVSIFSSFLKFYSVR